MRDGEPAEVLKIQRVRAPCTVHAQPSSSFVARRRTSITAPSLSLPNTPDFSM